VGAGFINSGFFRNLLSCVNLVLQEIAVNVERQQSEALQAFECLKMATWPMCLFDLHSLRIDLSFQDHAFDLEVFLDFYPVSV
jgi:hypothetical protein